MFKTRTLDNGLSLASQFMIVLYGGKCQKKTTCIWVVRYADLKLYSSVAAGILRNLKRLWNRLFDLATVILCSHDF